MHQLNTKQLYSDKNLIDPGNAAFSTLKINPGEVLLVKLAPHMKPYQVDIAQLLEDLFAKDGNSDRVIVYTEGDISFTKLDLTKR